MKMNFEKPTKIKDDAIVISGISGLYPNADNNVELWQNLYNKVDMVGKKPIPDVKHLELPQHYGKINDTERFDAQFFRVTPNQAKSFEPVGRKVMELAYTAMFDAGVNPETIKGTKLGVFVGFAQSDTHNSSVYNICVKNSFILTGTSKTMMANRVSYWVDAKGPSYGVDLGCASSMACLQLACETLSAGQCNSAIVCGVSHNCEPVFSLNMKRAGLLCLDGKTKCFDKNGDGYVRSEAVNVLFLQKAKDAKRIYAEICHVKGTYSLTTDTSFLPIRDPKATEKFLEEFYSEIDINPEEVEYIEANAAGISEADHSELEVISKIFGKKYPIKIGSIKSNLGHTESASGTVSVTKVCLAYKNGELPANLHYTKPLDVPAVLEGKLQIVTDNTSFGRGYVAINNFSFTGASYHALLKGHYMPKETKRYASHLPQLILVSGRHEEGVNKILDVIKNDKIDPEQIALLRDVFKFNIPGHTGRGFGIFDSEESKTVRISKNFQYHTGIKRPVCFMYSGLGSQWVGMGRELMNISYFADAIQKCHNVLKPKGMDLVDMITNVKRDDIINNILYSLIGITAIQIGLTDVLKAIGITPDLILGHSLGEIGCAYADGCFSIEEAMLASYCRSYVSSEIKFIKGKMAAVGLGYKEILKLCPPDIDVACRNSLNSTTISGPADIVDKFVGELKEQNVFAKTVATSNIAFHSRYISEAGPKLLSLMNDLISKPKRRSDKWLSTCYKPEQWDNSASQFASSEYFTQNLLNTVHFDQAAKHIPNDAVIIEIAPHGLMQAILKKSHANCLNLPLTRRNYDKNIIMILEAIGTLYQNGSNPDVSVLYPKVNFPVSTETPELSHLVQWDHDTEWTNIYKDTKEKHTSSYVEYIISINDDDYKFLKDYERNGKYIYPESSLLVLVWKTLAMYKNLNYMDISVNFSEVKFYNDVVIDSQEVLIMGVSLQKGINEFEVTIQGKLTVNGTIQIINDSNFQNNELIFDNDDLCLTKYEVYKLLSMHGFSFGSSFQLIKATNPSRNKALMKWNNDWVTFLDSVIQLNVISELDNSPWKVKRISSLNIYPTKHVHYLMTHNSDAEKYVQAHRNESGNTICGGIVCESVIFEHVSFDPLPSQILTQEFVPHICSHSVNVSTAVHVNMQIVYENIPNDQLKVGFIEVCNENIVSKKIIDEMSRTFSFEVIMKLIEFNDVDNANIILDDSDLIVCSEIIGYDKILQNMLFSKLNNNTFIMLMEDKKAINNFVVNNNLEFISRFEVFNNKEIVLLKKKREIKYAINPIIVSHVDELQFKNQNHNKTTILILDNNSDTNPKNYKKIIKDLLKQGKAISLVDVSKPASKSPVNIVFPNIQARKGLLINVFRNEEWGGYYTIPFKTIVDSRNIDLIKTLNDTRLFINNIKDVQVCYTGFCMKDYKDITLKENSKSCFLTDFSGIDSNGKRVMGCISGESITSFEPIDLNLLWPIPEHWSLEDAATVPLPYVYAYYCLTIRHRLQSKNTVLVMEGASALGQAIISLCLSLDCKIFATVSSKQEIAFLTRLFPQLNKKNIRLSVETEFRDYIISSTNNKRCRIVINCSSGEIRQAAVACIADFGYFLDVSEHDMKENELMFMKYIGFDKSYISVRFNSLFHVKSEDNKKMIHSAITEGIAKGIVKPLSRVVYTPTVIPKTLKLSSTFRNVGRMLIKTDNMDNQKYKEFRVILHPKRVYIVIWDGSEFGVEFLNRLIERGAKYIIIHNRQNTLTGYYLAKSLSWKSVKINISNENLSSVQGCKNLIKNGMKMGDIDGIFIINSYMERKKNTGSTADSIISNLDVISREITTLSYFTSLKFIQYTASEDVLSETERQLFMMRRKLGIPSLQITFKFKEMKYDLKTVTAILDGFEKSVKCKKFSVLLTDYEKFNTTVLKLANPNTKNQIISAEKLKLFVDAIDDDEFRATEPIISMKTLICEYNEDEVRIDPDERKAIIISGFLGNGTKLSTVAERLKISAIGLQITTDMDGSIFQLAENLLQCIKTKCRLKSKFYIIAHSFGVNIAMEMTALLEKEGYHGIVFCLDSSPLELQHQLKAYLGHLTEDELQNHIIHHTYSLLTGTSSQNLKAILGKSESWSEKILNFINHIKKVSSHSHDYLKDVINAIYKRILLAKEYKPDIKLISEIVLIKGLPDPKLDVLPDDYDLSKYTLKPVKVINVVSNHVSVLNDTRISNIINGMLEPELLELFANKNICKVYFG